MKTNIEEIIKKYKGNYLNIFANYYPAHGKAGFTERNQSVNFANAIMGISPDSFSWFEAPIGDNLHDHVDAVVFNKEDKEVFIIESKRFSTPKQKLASIGNDIKRITTPDNLKLITEELTDSASYKYFGVILADVWLETKKKIEIFNNWNEKFTETYKDALGLDEKAYFSQLHFEKIEFNNENSIKRENLKNNYKLLVLFGELIY